jgi:hypothetical protein
MTYFLRVFCRSSRAITRREIARFIVEGYFFDEKPSFEPSPESEAGLDENWRRFDIHYHPEKRPVILFKDVAEKMLQGEIKEILEELAPPPVPEVVVKALHASQQVIAIEIDQLHLTDDAWEMVDILEAFLARELDGIIYAPDDGFFDKKLRRISD